MKVTKIDGWSKTTITLTVSEMEYLKNLKALIFELSALKAGKEIIASRNLGINLSFANFKGYNKLELIWVDIA